VKFLLDMNLPRSLGRKLQAINHEARHVGDLGMAEADDIEIVQEARENQEVIITHDLDFGDLLAFSGESSPSIIIFRLRNTQLENLFAKILIAWPNIEQPLQNGALIVIGEQNIRVRELPIQ